ncbi:MAG: ribosome recycling factor [Candidatus Schekmanbacteria bacterium RBG_13_48_7]|uniref:Ribosome-recycling factor n=1 Tax=Candidatus Schekmanbacteria bacterium RBG_13_48_7 TaxID=1817878 RepID=A0A1F7RSN0_9BACT|nr:MAG: ribosome recycling factor [Candidatus Schekmanbacteria bacterium RBG_13_48_7]
MIIEIQKNTEEKMKNVMDRLAKELAGIRTGRATISLLDNIRINYYGNMSPLNQVASISVPESNLIVIQPWDTSIISDIEKAILRSDLGLVPNNDGKLLRVPVPPLTEERRKELSKNVKKMGEDHKIQLRNIRRDSNDEIKQLQKDKKLSQDEEHQGYDEIQKITDLYIEKVADKIKTKEKEILEF